MRRLIVTFALVLAGLVLGATPAAAQGAGKPGDRLAWDQAAATLAEAQGLTYSGYFDGATTAAVLPSTCSGAASPFVCTAPIPPLTTGDHTVQLTASLVLSLPDNRAIESAKSAVFTFRLFAAPSTPAQIRIVP